LIQATTFNHNQQKTTNKNVGLIINSTNNEQPKHELSSIQPTTENQKQQPTTGCQQKYWIDHEYS
jgi:hypothetical protein